MFISDTQWFLLQPLFPSASVHRRPAFDNRLVLELIFIKIVSRHPWYELPTSSPSWQTLYQYYRRWKVSGIWKSIISTLLADLNDRGGLDLLTAIEHRQVLVQTDCSGQLDISFPPQLENTWQQPAAALLIHLLLGEL